MWRVVDRLFGLVLLTAAASALYVVGAVGWSWWQGPNAPGGDPGVTAAPDHPNPLPSEAAVEIRVASHGGASTLFRGQPLVFDVVVQNLEAQRAQNRAQEGDAAATTSVDLPLDGRAAPWERRLALTMTTADGRPVLEEFDWTARLLRAAPSPSGRRLGLAPARATFVIDGAALGDQEPGAHEIRATLPADFAPVELVRGVPLVLDVQPAPTRDVDRATLTLAVAEVAALRGETAAAIEAAGTALELDPLRDRALTIIAEAYEAEGDLARAIEWYERYLETLPDADADSRAKLADYIDALRQQL